MDDDWPGARFRGATWVEFYGGPWDGTMAEEKQYQLPLVGKINVLAKGTSQAYAEGSADPIGNTSPLAG